MGRTFVLLILSFHLLALLTPSLIAKTADIDVYFKLGLDYRHLKRNGQIFFDSEIKIKSERIKGWKAALEAEAESDKRQFESKEVYVNYKWDQANKVYFGYRKSRLGLESMISKRDRFFARKSILSDKLEELAYIAYQPQIAWRQSKDRLHYRVALGLPSSLDYNMQMSAMVPLSSDYETGFWLTMQRDRQDGERQSLVGATSFSLSKVKEPFKLDIELSSGIDPLASELNSLEKAEKIFFYGSRIEFWLQESESPWAFGSRALFLQNNHKIKADYKFSIGFGLSYRQSKLISYSLSGDLIGQRNPIDPDDISYLNSRAIIETRVFF